MERNPHLLIEGCAIACHAIGAKVAYIYIRGEFFHVQHVLERAIDEAYARGFLGRNVLGSGVDCDVYVHRGAGAYEAGEETALLESLEGQARPAEEQAAVSGRGRPLQLPDRRQQRRDAGQRAADRQERRRVVCGAWPREERRAEAVLRQRPRAAAGRLRSVDEHHAPRADRRARRRRARGPDAEGRDPGRLLGADSPARSARYAGQLRRRAESRVAPRLGWPHRARRHDVHGVAGREPAALLPSRVVRQVHAVPRRHGLAAQDPVENRAGRRRDARSRPARRAFRATSAARRSARSATRPSRRCSRRSSTSARSTRRTSARDAARCLRPGAGQARHAHAGAH